MKIKEENEAGNLTTLERIIEGLRELTHLNQETAERGHGIPATVALTRTAFLRLTESYKNPDQLKEAGLSYLRQLNVSGAALPSSEDPQQKGFLDSDLLALVHTAKVDYQRRLAQRCQTSLREEGYNLPDIPELIARTGKLLLTPGPGLSISPDASALVEEPKDADPIPTDMATCLKQAAIAISEFRLRRARTLLEAVKIAPDNNREMWLAWTNLGYAFYRMVRYPEAEEAFREAFAFGSNDMASHFNVALGQHLNQRFELAFASYLAADRIEPNHPKVWCNLGALYFHKDLFGRAEEALLNALKADASYARAWDNLGAALGAQGKFDEALTACQSALELREHYPEAHFKIALIYFHRGDFELSRTSFQRAYALPLLSSFCDAFMAVLLSRT